MRPVVVTDGLLRPGGQLDVGDADVERQADEVPGIALDIVTVAVRALDGEVLAIAQQTGGIVQVVHVRLRIEVVEGHGGLAVHLQAAPAAKGHVRRSLEAVARTEHQGLVDGPRVELAGVETFYLLGVVPVIIQLVGVDQIGRNDQSQPFDCCTEITRLIISIISIQHCR